MPTPQTGYEAITHLQDGARTGVLVRDADDIELEHTAPGADATLHQHCTVDQALELADKLLGAVRAARGTYTED